RKIIRCNGLRRHFEALAWQTRVAIGLVDKCDASITDPHNIAWGQRRRCDATPVEKCSIAGIQITKVNAALNSLHHAMKSAGHMVGQREHILRASANGDRL